MNDLTLSELSEVRLEAEGRLAKARASVEHAETALAALAREPNVSDDDLAEQVLARNTATAAADLAERRLQGIGEQIAAAEVEAARLEVERYLAEHRDLAAGYNAAVERVEDQVLAAATELAKLSTLEFSVKQALAAAQGTARPHDLPVPHGSNLVPRISQLMQLLPIADAVRISRSVRPKSAA